ncbi:hypothetical protein L228DRAFT_25675 [Xylona heveae TC161]|uniref:Uncharacterized protein n=1 Tax=Xylona heveae (strain CBS 132557 / TC161) TaxID=1328760 RepID=A0A165ADL3_XYLHT|nr:hypothetical protein L228DRAFT_25675 [Xylona heveae TC161]KZF20303.1 hypothetical protein L228DRAFT_25675 [Xylona heveae TC161]
MRFGVFTRRFQKLFLSSFSFFFFIPFLSSFLSFGGPVIFYLSLSTIMEALCSYLALFLTVYYYPFCLLLFP